jgi:putative nucleotidyltransferase with HDIG domain/diguanylate cyclase (GGDEF)-like protein
MHSLKELKSLTKDMVVLYVEDDVVIAKSMQRYLDKFFAKVVCADDGIHGLEKFAEQTFDIVIADISMPRLNGIDMVEQIRKTKPAQAVIITSAHNESEYMFSAIELNVDGYIVKPFDFEKLNETLYKISNRLVQFKENELYKKNLQEILNHKTDELSKSYHDMLYAMVDIIEQRDTYTAGHSNRVATYSKMIAKDMGHSKEECDLIYQAGILHDIGKVATPDAVLLNPKNLNNIEYKLIQEHVGVSYKILNNINIFQPISEIVYSHHEKYDGSGYPRGLKNEEIEPLARIMIVADAFDAMTTNRIYKAKKSTSEALHELNQLINKDFDPDVVKQAVITLKDVTIGKNITQLPKSKLEEERFAYFYKDTIINIYNQNYLETLLIKNSYDKEFKYLEIFSLKNFSQYNKKHGWEEGDKILTSFANILSENCGDCLVFRVFGDDFVIIKKEYIDIGKIKLLEDVLLGTQISYKVDSVDLIKKDIKSITQIESIQSAECCEDCA